MQLRLALGGLTMNNVINKWATYDSSVKYKPSGLIGDVENVVEQSDACVVGRGLIQKGN